MLLLALLAFVSSASARTIYVPTDYETIQQAIAAASPGVSFTKDRLTLQGEDASTITNHEFRRQHQQ